MSREKTAEYLLQWLIDHKIQCDGFNCLCSASTPEDALVELFDKNGDLELAECLKLSAGRINETRKELGLDLITSEVNES